MLYRDNFPKNEAMYSALANDSKSLFECDLTE